MSRENTEELHGYLQNVQASYLLGLSFKTLLKNPKFVETIENIPISINNQTINVTLPNLNPDKIEGIFIFNSIISSYESLKKYLNETKQFDKFRKQKFYLYFTVLRHSFTHDYTWNFGKYLDQLPISYNGNSLTTKMDKTELRFEDFNGNTLWKLLEDVRIFVKNDLK